MSCTFYTKSLHVAIIIYISLVYLIAPATFQITRHIILVEFSNNKTDVTSLTIHVYILHTTHEDYGRYYFQEYMDCIFAHLTTLHSDSTTLTT